RLKNYTEPDILMEEFGADALRLTFITSGLVKGEELKFTDEGVKDMVRRALLPWYNSFKFFNTYAKVDGWSAEKDLQFGKNILDRWVLSKLQTLVKNVTHEMESYRLYNVVPQLFNFIEDLTNWYIRLNRRRFWEGKSLTQEKKEAYSTLYTTLKELSKIMAPFAPFLSEHIYLELKKFGESLDESVHLAKYPAHKSEAIDASLEDAVTRMQQLILLGRQKRNQAQVKVKTPLANLTAIHKKDAALEGLKQLERYIKTELNVKKISYSNKEEKYIKLRCLPNAPVLGKRLGKNFGKYRKLIQSLDSETLARVEQGQSVELEEEQFEPEDFLILREAQSGSNALSNRWITIDLDTRLSQELIDEGAAREIVNRIQRTRKDRGFNVDDRINVDIETGQELKNVIERHLGYIKEETLTS
ncbi:MAG: DUF5915 domain-containing protein, partial [Bacteriovoracaceae bacterium]